MASASKQPVKKAGWGSLLSGAVAGLESRLDTILADDSEASAKSRAAEEALKQAKAAQSRPRTNSGNLAPPGSDSSRPSRELSRTRAADRLAERLAKATAVKTPSQIGSEVPSRVGSPAVGADNDHVLDSSEDRRSIELENVTERRNDQQVHMAEDVPEEEQGTLLASQLPINPARLSVNSSRPSLEVTVDDAPLNLASALPNGDAHVGKSSSELEAELMQLREDHAFAEKQRQDEMHTYLEKIDALQAKLQYLARETVAAAKEANASTASGTPEAKLAEKDEQIASLMEEGEKLSKTELRHLQTIKKLRAKATEDEKAFALARKRLERAERAEGDLRTKLRRAEVAERQASEKSKQISDIERQVQELEVDRERASELIRKLTTDVKAAKEKADRAESEAALRASEVDRGRIAGLENELEDAQIEKKLAADRAKAELEKANEETEAQKQRFEISEMELKNEIARLESRLEAMHSRAEEASAEGVSGSGESNVQLLRQVETLQTQYALAKENWETIEGSLDARLAAVEKERDESTRREAEVRKKVRETGVRARKLEEELEGALEQARTRTYELQIQQDIVKSLQSRHDHLEASIAESKSEMDRRRHLWEVELQQRLEEERGRWQRSAASSQVGLLRTEAPANLTRKSSSADTGVLPASSRRPATSRLNTHDLANFYPDPFVRPSSRRSSNFPFNATPPTTSRTFVPGPLDRSSEASPTISRQQSTISFDGPDGIPPTPGIEIGVHDVAQDNFSETAASPDDQRTLADLVSVSNATGTGPSVQLVERMSAAVRRLESEKAGFKDEVARLAAQRDSARDEVVDLMREVEAKRNAERKSEDVSKEMAEVRRRYDASLEMLGEREEEVDELRQDVAELKRMYRQLVEEKVGPARG